MRTNHHQFRREPQRPSSGYSASATQKSGSSLLASTPKQVSPGLMNLLTQSGSSLLFSNPLYRPSMPTSSSSSQRPGTSAMGMRQKIAAAATAAATVAPTTTAIAASPARTIPWRDTGLPFTSTGMICYRKHGFVPEDFVNSHNRLLVSDGSYYLGSLRQASQHYGFSLKEIPEDTVNDNLWLRDYYLNSYNNSTVVLDKRFSSINSVDLFSSSRHFPNTVLCKDRDCKIKHKITWKNPSNLPNKVSCKQLHANFMRKVIPDQRLYYSLSQGRTELLLRPSYVKPKAFATQQTDINIEGGNVIQAVNQEGIPKLIIGLNGLLGTAFLQTLLTLNSNFDEVIQIAKKRISEVMDIEPENIIIVPQWIYHLDCMLAYAGNATFLVHSFEITFKTLNTMKPPTQHKDLYARLRTTAGLGYTKFETSVVNALIDQLTAHGFRAVKCMGVLFHGRGVDDHSCNAYETFSSAPITVANFMNGVAGTTRSGTRFYLTNNCGIMQFNILFSKFLRSLAEPIEAYYCSVDQNEARTNIGKWLRDLRRQPGDAHTLMLAYYSQGILNNTTFLMSLSSGGLRCQTNMYYDHDMPEITRPTVASAA